jgi:hypothetical protein
MTAAVRVGAVAVALLGIAAALSREFRGRNTECYSPVEAQIISVGGDRVFCPRNFARSCREAAGDLAIQAATHDERTFS